MYRFAGRGFKQTMEIPVARNCANLYEAEYTKDLY
jgi:hypothetical protein